MTKLWTVSRVCANGRKSGKHPVQCYAVVADTAQGALEKIEARQPGVPAAFLAVHEEAYGIALGRRFDAPAADLEAMRESAAALHNPLCWKPRKKREPDAPARLSEEAGGRRVGNNQLRLLRLLEAKGRWHRGIGWGTGGDFETAKLADALLTRGLLETNEHVLVRVRRQGLPANLAPQTRAPVFVLSEAGRAVLALDDRLKRQELQGHIAEHTL